MKYLLLVLGLAALLVGISMIAFGVVVPGLFLGGIGIFAMLMPLAKRPA